MKNEFKITSADTNTHFIYPLHVYQARIAYIFPEISSHIVSLIVSDAVFHVGSIVVGKINYIKIPADKYTKFKNLIIADLRKESKLEHYSDRELWEKVNEVAGSIYMAHAYKKRTA